MELIKKDAIRFVDSENGNTYEKLLENVWYASKKTYSDSIEYYLMTKDDNEYEIDKETYDYVEAYLIKMIEKNQLIEEEK